MMWNEILLKFPKSQRYSLGDKGSTYLLASLENVLSAAAITDHSAKLFKLTEASGKLDTLKILARLSKDCKCISNDKYQQFESKLHEAGKMLGGWLKSLESKKAL